MPKKMHSHLLGFYGDGLMGKQNVIKWYVDFEKGENCDTFSK